MNKKHIERSRVAISEESHLEAHKHRDALTHDYYI